MITWLRNLMGSRRDTRFRRRGLFRYHDGTRWRYADPFRVWRDMVHHPDIDFKNPGDALDRGEEPETTNWIEALCEIFDVERFDEKTGHGMADWEILALLDQMAEFQEGLKKNTVGSST